MNDYKFKYSSYLRSWNKPALVKAYLEQDKVGKFRTDLISPFPFSLYSLFCGSFPFMFFLSKITKGAEGWLINMT